MHIYPIQKQVLITLTGYFYATIWQFIAMKRREYNLNGSLNHYSLIDFAQGIIEGFRSKLESKEEEGEKDGKILALSKWEASLLKKYIVYRYPHKAMIRTGRGR